METLLIIVLASVIVSLISFSGAILFIAKEKKVQKYMILFVALAAGTLLGTAFFHLIPESFSSYEEGDHNEIHNEKQNSHEGHELFIPSLFILFGILTFYIIEKFVHWHHHHDIDCNHHSLSTLSLVGDFFHNLIDGTLIAAAFVADIRLGIATTIAIILHEIPQEIGDLAILLHSGMNKYKALFFNFLSALGSLIGAVLMFFFIGEFEHTLPILLAFVAGSFIYISLADIIPELHKKHKVNNNVISLIFFLGILLSYSLEHLAH